MTAARCLLAFAVGLGVLSLPAAAQEPHAARGVIQKDEVVAGSTKVSLEVRHLVLKGTNEEIGRALATLARERYQLKPQPSQDSLRTRAQRRYIEKNYLILFERMR